MTTLLFLAVILTFEILPGMSLGNRKMISHVPIVYCGQLFKKGLIIMMKINSSMPAL